jgi:hypothetical protein
MTRSFKMEKLFAVKEFSGRPGRIEDHGVVFEGDLEDCEKFVDAREAIFSLTGDPDDTFFEIDPS